MEVFLAFVHRRGLQILLALCLIFCSVNSFSQDLKFGAYYFDGWTNTYPFHITDELKTKFKEREPKWGWVTSSQKIVDEQISLAADAGLKFFSFCWYYSNRKGFKQEALNQALGFFEHSPVNYKLEYCLLIANHGGFSIRAEDWNIVENEWIRHFTSPRYFRNGKKPLIIFFSPKNLINDLGSIENTRVKLRSLRDAANRNGIKEIDIAACVGPNALDIEEAKSAGFNILTGFNYHSELLSNENNQLVPISSKYIKESKIWDRIVQLSNADYIPAVTLNWDPRPWANEQNHYKTKPYFIGYSPGSAFQSIKHAADWSRKDGRNRIAIIYAWNEYGEGAYLTPTKNNVNFKSSIRRALK
jgi:hypothetical protein